MEYAIWDHSVTCHPTQVNAPHLTVQLSQSTQNAIHVIAMKHVVHNIGNEISTSIYSTSMLIPTLST